MNYAATQMVSCLDEVEPIAFDVEQAVWRRIEVRSFEALDRLAARIGPLASQNPHATHEHDLRWMAAGQGHDDLGLTVCVLEYADAIWGYAPLVKAAWHFWHLEIGPFELWQVPVDRFNWYACPFFAAGLHDHEEVLTIRLLKVMRKGCHRRQLLAVRSVMASSTLARIAGSRRLPREAGYRLLPHEPADVRRVLTLPPTFDAYLASLGRSTRQTLNRRHRKLMETHRVTLEIATGPADIDRMLEAAVEISQKTYQWREGVGLNDRDHAFRCMISAAESGRLRWYLLRCDGRPVAFMSGYLSGDRFIWPNLGFDPAWSEQAVGLVLQYLVIKDLIDNMPGISRYDCGEMDSENKRRFVKGGDLECHLHLVPTTMFGTTLWAIASLQECGVGLAKKMLAVLAATRSLVSRWSAKTVQREASN